jgi:tol-pal system protein YbgF
MPIKFFIILFITTFVFPYAATAGDIADRLSRLENIIANQNQQLSQLENIQAQMKELQGHIEVLTNENAQLKQQQISYFTDLDQRLVEQEKSVNSSRLPDQAVSKSNSALVAPPLLKNASDLPAQVQSTASLTPLPAAPASEVRKEGDLYQGAFGLLKEKKYLEATTQFKIFLTTYPESSYVPNAHYWLGELYLAQSPSAKADAKKEFSLLRTQYPQHPKVPDAMLKMASIEYEQGDQKIAIESFKKIVSTYPGTSAANLAQAKLDSLKK